MLKIRLRECFRRFRIRNSRNWATLLFSQVILCFLLLLLILFFTGISKNGEEDVRAYFSGAGDFGDLSAQLSDIFSPDSPPPFDSPTGFLFRRRRLMFLDPPRFLKLQSLPCVEKSHPDSAREKIRFPRILHSIAVLTSASLSGQRLFRFFRERCEKPGTIRPPATMWKLSTQTDSGRCIVI